MNRIELHPENKVCGLGDLYGIFFEDINHAADGGLYAQMVQNYAFEYCAMDNPAYRALTAWEILQAEDTQMSVSVCNQAGYSKENPHYLMVEVTKPGSCAGFLNVGYNRGMYIEKDKTYRFSCYAKKKGEEPVVYQVTLQGINGQVYARQELCITSENWEKYNLELTADTEDTAGRLAIMTAQTGCASFDFISLFPKDTFRGRENGMRKDIAEMLAELKPKFMRFPGGCLIHDGSLNADDRDSMYRWKNTIGPVEHRPARKNNWGYNQSLGLGYYEYFLFCEDIGAKPLPILPAGFNPHSGQGAPMDAMQEWIDDALDLIEFANGSVDSEWGSKRAGMGHPLPFGLEYIGIGNEEAGDGFFRRYPMFHKAIKDRYPEIKIVNSAGPFAGGQEYECGWKSARENHSDLVDEHYYTSPEWMLANFHRYDNYKADDPHVFLGEYASWGNTWYNGLCEAAYMIGLEKNAEKVALACYAPLLCNTDYVNWKPDLIWFDNHRVYGSVNYYVQKLFMRNQGTHKIEAFYQGLDKQTVINDGAITGALEFYYSDSEVEYTNISLTDNKTGKTIEYADICVDREHAGYILDTTDSDDYTLHFCAKKIRGRRGFVVSFGQKERENRYDWSLGGWGNDITEIISFVKGRSSSLSQERFHAMEGVVYECALHVKGRHVTGTVKDYVETVADDKPLILEELYAAASVEEESGDVILKAVNVQEHEVKSEICLPKAGDAVVYTMAGYALDAENSFDSEHAAVPIEQKIAVNGETMEYTFPPQSITLIRFYRKGEQVS